MDANRVYVCACGKVKTRKNTTVNRNYNDTECYASLCRKCTALYSRRRNMGKKTDDELIALKEKHLQYAVWVDEEIQGRAKNNDTETETIPHADKSSRSDSKAGSNLRDVGHEPRKDVHVHHSGEEVGPPCHGSSSPKRCSNNLAG